MSFADFLNSTAVDAVPPSGLRPALAALWHDQRGQWDTAHTLAQEILGQEGSRVHAYLHRKEGDQTNAGYWYRQAGRSIASGDLAAEWEQIVRELLAGNDRG